jgi:hypothetical protein
MSASDEFSTRLELFRRQVDEAAQFLYVAETIHERARLNRKTFDAINLAPGFWMTVAGGMQMSAIIGVGRIFGAGARGKDRPQHTVDTLLRFAEQHLEMFSREALLTRKRRAGVAAEHLPDIAALAHVPSAKDLHRLGAQLRSYRRAYRSQFADIRNLDLAHTVVIDSNDRSELYARTRRRDLERMIVRLTQIHNALWHLFNNGLRPRLTPMAWASRALVRRPVGDRRKSTAHEAIVIDTKKCLQMITEGAAASRRRRVARGRPVR